MEKSKYIAQVRVGDCATVRVLQIIPDQVIECDRNCPCLEESRDGSVQCSIGWIVRMVNFKTKALIIDYEVVLDRDSDWDWPVCAEHFPVIDDTGQIHKGEFICKDIITPQRIPGGADTLFPGTRGKYRVYYETFPKDGKVASIMAVRIGNIQGRMDLLSDLPSDDDPMEQPESTPVALQEESVLRERLERLEKQVNQLSAENDSLRLMLARKDAVSSSLHSDVMTDPGIGYQPLEHNK